MRCATGFLSRSSLMFFCFGAVVACKAPALTGGQGKSEDGDECKPGAEACECKDDGSCDEGLSCISGLCVDDRSGGSASGVSGGNEPSSSSGEDSHDGPTGGTSGAETSDGEAGESGMEEGQDSDDRTPLPEGEELQLDILFVVDNSGSMGEEQVHLSRSLPHLVRRLEAGLDRDGEHRATDVHVMVTTTDFGNPLCKDDHHPPERGAPVTSSCTERLEHFTSIDASNPVTFDEGCLSACPDNVSLQKGAYFLAFSDEGRTHNLANPPGDRDLDGDGVLEDAVTQGISCLLPQGIDGCGFESPLESMMQSLYPGAEWNQGDQTFLRDDAILAIVIISDEIDCSVKDFSVMSDPEYTRELNGKKTPSSAICWDAGVECDEDPAEPGSYTACRSVDRNKLFSLTRYTDYLLEHLSIRKGKEIYMLGILGVPESGVEDLQYRDWKDGQYPEGDILPQDFPERNAEYKQWAFGIGPGCTGSKENEDGETEYFAQAIPPVRMKEVCESLNNIEGNGETRCCLQSICNPDQGAAIDCLLDRIEEN